jgi:hypothetical protein
VKHVIFAIGAWATIVGFVLWVFGLVLDLPHAVSQLRSTKQDEALLFVERHRGDPTTPEFGATRNARQELQGRAKR